MFFTHFPELQTWVTFSTILYSEVVHSLVQFTSLYTAVLSCTVYSRVRYILYTVYLVIILIMYSNIQTVHSIHCTLYILYTLYTVHSIHGTLYTLYTLWTLYTPCRCHKVSLLAQVRPCTSYKYGGNTSISIYFSTFTVLGHVKFKIDLLQSNTI